MVSAYVNWQIVLDFLNMLGNYTFGYIGKAFGFSLRTLIAGSVYAAPLSTWEQVANEFTDWVHIRRGFSRATRW